MKDKIAAIVIFVVFCTFTAIISYRKGREDMRAEIEYHDMMRQNYEALPVGLWVDCSFIGGPKGKRCKKTGDVGQIEFEKEK